MDLAWLVNGLYVMLYGMGTVFSFLILLVVLMQVASWFFTTFAHWFPEEEVAAPVVAKKATDNADIAVAIAAVQAFRSK